MYNILGLRYAVADALSRSPVLQVMFKHVVLPLLFLVTVRILILRLSENYRFCICFSLWFLLGPRFHGWGCNDPASRSCVCPVFLSGGEADCLDWVHLSPVLPVRIYAPRYWFWREKGEALGFLLSLLHQHSSLILHTLKHPDITDALTDSTPQAFVYVDYVMTDHSHSFYWARSWL